MPDTLEQLAAILDTLPAAEGAALKAEAYKTATQIAHRAAQILLSKTRAVKTAASIRVLDQPDRHQWLVNCPGDPKDPANLPIWFEFGTRYMTAKPFMRPAADEAVESYRRNMTRVAEDLLASLLGG